MWKKEGNCICKDLGDQRLLSTAFLNLAIAEAERHTKNYIKFSETALKNSKSQTDDPSIFLLRKQLLNLIGSKTANGVYV
jgi:hypothetical protein